MWEAILGRMPAGMVLICTILSGVIPYTIYKINQKLHEIGDPPWMKQQQDEN